MSANSINTTARTSLLILLGLLALIAGVKWLAVLIPAAMLVWYVSSPALRSGRN
jgi:hypothetical protein